MKKLLLFSLAIFAIFAIDSAHCDCIADAIKAIVKVLASNAAGPFIELMRNKAAVQLNMHMNQEAVNSALGGFLNQLKQNEGNFQTFMAEYEPYRNRINTKRALIFVSYLSDLKKIIKIILCD